MPESSGPKTVVVKFAEDARIGVEEEAFTTPDAGLSGGLAEVLAAFPDARVGPLFTRPAADLAAEAESAGSEAPELTRYYRIDGVTEGAEDMAARLRDLPGVQIAYVEPDYDVASRVPDTQLEGMVLTAACPPGPMLCPPAPIGCPPAPIRCPPAPVIPTPDLTAHQTYLEPSSACGIDARFAWTKPGGKGLNAKFCDIEFGWDVLHEDLPTSASTPTYGTNTGDDHGTNVLGEVVSKHNGRGVSGIAPQAQVARLCSIQGTSVADCINQASASLSAGDVILIELQSRFRPVEVVEANYDAIRAAIAAGRIVVEAAGNGSYDLDAYSRPASMGGGGYIFRRSVRDSGAIVVGAGCPPSGTFGSCRSRWMYSNFGTRLDLQGHGREVYTTGGGDAFDAGPHRRYNKDFQNTSAASPQVVGACLCVQGIRKARGDAVLTAAEMRSLLVSTGSSQVNGNYGPATQQIGPLPNLRKAYEKLYPVIVCPAPIACRIAPTSTCRVAPVLMCAPGPTARCPAAPLIHCAPGPVTLACPPAPGTIECPPAPAICRIAPVAPCAAGPTPGVENPNDWVDPVFEYRYIEDVGHVLVLVRKGQLEAGRTPEDEAADAAEAAAYGYDEVYWSYSTEPASDEGDETAAAKPEGELKPTAKKRKR